MTPDASPVGHGRDIEWVNGITKIHRYLADHLGPHDLTFSKDRVRTLLDALEGPHAAAWGLAGRTAVGRPGTGHTQTRSVDRSVLDGLIAGDHAGLAAEVGFPTVPTGNVVPLRPADVAHELFGARDTIESLRRQVEELTAELADAVEENAGLRRLVRDQAVLHARVIGSLEPDGDA